MMEINVTEYVEDIDCEQFSSSIAESGLENIGRITWRNACHHVACEGLVAPDKESAQGELRAWLADFGAWSRAEIADMSDRETNALLLQFVAGAVRELERYDSYDEYLAACENGQVGHELYRGDDGQWYFYVGM
jgi:hypothetical protein